MFLLLAKSWAVDISFGKKGLISYDLKKGTFKVFNQTTQWLDDGFSLVKTRNMTYSSKDYTNRTFTKEMLNDRIGKGKKYSIILKGKGLAEMRQIFYAYDALPYFLCSVQLIGNSLASNEMFPIQGVTRVFGGSSEINSVFVPFDNDTFISYNTKQLSNKDSQVSAEVGALYNEGSRTGLIAGSVEQGDWKTGVETKLNIDKSILLAVKNGFTDQRITRDTITHGYIKGKLISSSRIFFGAFADWRKGMEAYAKVCKLADAPIVFKWKQATPVGWNSWGAMQEHISYEKAIKTVDYFADSLKGFRSGGTAFIDLDSYWDKLIDGGLEGDFSRLKAFAAYTKKRGLRPGVYWAPFTDWGFKGGSGRRVEGSNYTYGELWTKTGKTYHDIDGARALDPTHPGTQKRIALVIGKLKECGFEMIKIDFLGHAAIESTHFYNTRITTGMQAYREGMQFLLRQLDGKMLIYAAISPNIATARYVHMRRIACDAFHSISDTKYTLNSLTYGWWQTYLYDYIDADHVVLKTEKEGANRARLFSALATGSLIVGDDFSEDGPWKDRAKKLFQNPELLQIIEDGRAFRPMENHNAASTLFTKHVKGITYLVAFNYNDDEKRIAMSKASMRLDEKQRYIATDVLSDEKILLTGNSNFTLPAADARIFKISKIEK
ncbi:MAG: alpha-galactosidase [Pedobacter sp.]|nr:MAG: alpha-galactosidase [Pedobacter sp.]